MKKNVKTAITAAIFAAAVGVSPAESPVFAVTSFSPESQLAAYTTYGPAPVGGDADGNRLLDARDLTLLKRFLIRRKEDSSYIPENYGSYFFDENIAGSSDARTLRNILTGLKEPVSFQIEYRPVAWLSSEKPESEEACLALQQQARELYRQNGDVYYYPYAQNEKGEDVFLDQKAWLHAMVYPSRDYITVSFTAVPDPDHPERTTLRIRLHFRYLTPEESQALSERGVRLRENVHLPESPEPDKDIVLELELTSRLVQPDGSVQYYDKCILEYDILTGKYAILDTLTPEQEFPSPISD